MSEPGPPLQRLQGLLLDLIAAAPVVTQADLSDAASFVNGGILPVDGGSKAGQRSP